MENNLELFTTAFVLYFLAIDPLGTVAIFLSIISKIKYHKHKVALEATIFAFIILAFFLFLGKFLLKHLSIALYSFQIAGGIILLFISLEMMFDKRSERKEKSLKFDFRYNAIFPLAIPLLAGPASITSVIINSGAKTDVINHIIFNLIAIFSVLFITLLLFIVAIKSEKFLNKKVLQVLSRIIGILLAALSVQFILDGIYYFYVDNF